MPVDERVTSVFLSIRSSLARAVMGIVPPKEIEDIVQETYVRVCQIRTSNEITSPRSFMFRTARNLALNHVNRAESRLLQSYEDAEGIADAALSGHSDETLDQVCTDEEFSFFCDAVRHLPVQCGRAFILMKVYGYTQREVGKTLHISEKTVEKHIANGIKRCRNYMLQQYDGHRDADGLNSGRRSTTKSRRGDGT